MTEEPANPSEQSSENKQIVYRTDSTEWHVYTAHKSVLYGSGYSVKDPYHIPTREEAAILKTCTYGDGSQRFVTCDGYTFGMPSASVSKAGAKTKYSVLGLWVRNTIITIEF